MILITKVLKRRDASSVLVAIVLAMILGQLLSALTAHLSGIITGLEEGQYIAYSPPGTGLKGQYLQPAAWAALQVSLLEVILWVYTGLVTVMKQSSVSNKKSRK